MVWVRSEYAGELAVVSAWLAAVVPWNVTYASAEGLPGKILYLRFPFFEVQYLIDFEINENQFFLNTIGDAVSQQIGQGVFVAYATWLAGAALVGFAVLVSIAYYLEEERVEAGPVDPIMLIGGLLTVAGVVLAVASYLFVARGIPGYPLPVGTVLLLVLGGTLLRVDRREDVDPESVDAEA
ncbi:DUF7549 family protein [Haloparvum sp. AD34]